NMTYAEMLQMLTSGRGIDYAIRFIEGWTVQEALAEFSKHDDLVKDVELSLDSVRALLNIEQSNIEGWLFPDTYYYSKNGLLSDLLKTMHQRMLVSLNDAWAQRATDVYLETPYELLILASIIEKESALASERDVISGVFHRRLQLGMRLQTDPTVIYGLGPDFDGDIRRRDLRTKTPYNTYVIKGLPPTPIALPSQESLIAAAKPAAGTALYFVSRGDGSHVFSDTLEQHNRAVRKYQLGKN
ncbi:MAG: endolytic transglycosylase MltG, partial [Gammaproteobacteria bacterium]|nr:endolytic transglycosylase MltG [Gammaproteobacteria bacterium]NNJ72206.1 endolytic transglycosylase MltG [Enterobacterales bacterium]